MPARALRGRLWLRRHANLAVPLVAMATLALLLGVFDYIHLNRQFADELESRARLVAHSASAAVVFDSPREAAEILAAFDSVPSIVRARLVRPDGSVLAERMPPSAASRAPWARIGGNSHSSVDVLANGRSVGQLQLSAQRGEVIIGLVTRMASLLLTMAAALAFSLIVSRRLLSAERRTAFLAHHDALTGLANRATFAAALESTLALADHQPAVLLCIDLDNFKPINDTLGHAAGDAALAEVAARLRRLAGASGLPARLGGDEFALLLSGPRCVDEATRLARALIDEVPRLELEGSSLALGLSIGMACLPADADSADDAMQHADVALYHAKRSGKGQLVRYSPALGEARRQRLQLEQDLRDAIAAGALRFAYQPIFDRDGRVRCLEALARWQHPQRGTVSPVDFVPVAEESGLIVELGLALMRRARDDLDNWLAAGLAPPPIAMNLSARQLRREADRQRFLGRLDELGFAPHELEFELTESVVFEDLHSPSSVLTHLQQRGFRLAIDDFGTGYSSLGYLRRIRARKLKIDRMFVRGIHADPDNALMVESILRVAHALDMLAVAEGVETPADHALLLRLGCDLFQGFGLALPLDADTAAAWLRAGGRSGRDGALASSANGEFALSR